MAVANQGRTLDEQQQAARGRQRAVLAARRGRGAQPHGLCRLEAGLLRVRLGLGLGFADPNPNPNPNQVEAGLLDGGLAAPHEQQHRRGARAVQLEGVRGHLVRVRIRARVRGRARVRVKVRIRGRGRGRV